MIIVSLTSSFATADTTWQSWTSGTLDLGQNITLDGSTYTTRNLTGNAVLNGDGFIIDGNNKYRSIVRYYNQTPITLELKNVNVSNGYSEAGSAAWIRGTVLLTAGKNTFTGNVARGTGSQCGGAIHAKGVFQIDGGVNTFSNNSVAGSTCGHGGAVFVDCQYSEFGQTTTTNGRIFINGGTNTFSNNSSTYGGGAVFAQNSITISGGKNTFLKNSAATGATTENGGAMHTTFLQVVFSGGSTEVTFLGNTANGRNNDVNLLKSYMTIQDAGTYFFGGGIDTADATNGYLSISKGANVTFGAGSETSLASDFKLTGKTETDASSAAVNLTINLTRPTQKMIDEDGVIDMATSFSVKSVQVTGTNNLNVISSIAKRGDSQTVITTTNGVTGFDNLNWTVDCASTAEDAWVKVKDNNIVVLSPLVGNSFSSTTDKDISIHDVYNSSATDQTLTFYGDVVETQTTTLNNDTLSTPTSNLTLQSDSNTVRKISEQNSSTPIFTNTAGTTKLTVNDNIELDDYIIKANGQDVYLSGKVNIGHKSGSLDSAQIVANNFYLDNAEVTIGSTDSTTADTLKVEGNFETLTDSFINLDIFKTGPYAEGDNDALVVDGELLISDDTEIRLNPQTSFGSGEEFWVKFTGDTVGSDTITNMQTILDKLCSTGPFSYLEFVEKGGVYYIHGTLVPEPSTWALLILGCAGLMWWLKRSERREKMKDGKIMASRGA